MQKKPQHICVLGVRINESMVQQAQNSKKRAAISATIGLSAILLCKMELKKIRFKNRKRR